MQRTRKRDGASHFQDRLREALGERSPADVARRVGIPKQSLHNALANGSMPAADRVFALADELAVDPRWLATGEGARTPKTRIADAAESDWVHLPRYDLSAFVSETKPEPSEVVPIRRDLLNRTVRTTTGLWLTEMPTAQMPSIAAEGDLVVCQEIAGPIQDGRVYIFSLDGLPIVRRVAVRPEGLVLRAGDTDPDPIVIGRDDYDAVYPIARVLAALNLSAI